MPITIVGLGPGAIDDLTQRAWRCLEAAPVVYLRTREHPLVPDLPPGPDYRSFDALYAAAGTFDAVYDEIAATLVALGATTDVVYAVPGDPGVGEATTARIQALAREQQIPVALIHGVSFIEPMLGMLGLDALDGLQIVDGLEAVAMRHHPPLNPALPALVAQVYSRQVASDVKLTLMNQYPDAFEVTLVHAAGTGDDALEVLPLHQIDQSTRIAHLTSLYVPALGPRASFEAFQETIAHLRAPEGCPWDRKQTHLSLRPYLLEETCEVLEALDAEDDDALAEELGDLMLQILLHVQIATEGGSFQMADVIERHITKLVRRHPHVWGDTDVGGSAEQVKSNWDAIKAQEKLAGGARQSSILDGLPRELPALAASAKLQARAASVGFDWPDIAGVEAKLQEEVAELLAATECEDRIAEAGDLLFVIVNLLRWLGQDDPESVLRAANRKFRRRFTAMEAQLSAEGRSFDDLDLDGMNRLWDAAKAAE
jgi:tetrapyrrole methylase family protein / MazG family protein